MKNNRIDSASMMNTSSADVTLKDDELKRFMTKAVRPRTLRIRSMGVEQKLLISLLLLAMLSVCVFLSVYLVQMNRQLYGNVEQLRSESELLQAEWSQLLVEHSVYSEQGRIESVAKQRLGMVRPGHDLDKGVAQNTVILPAQEAAN